MVYACICFLRIALGCREDKLWRREWERVLGARAAEVARVRQFATQKQDQPGTHGEATIQQIWAKETCGSSGLVKQPRWPKAQKVGSVTQEWQTEGTVHSMPRSAALLAAHTPAWRHA